MEIKDLAEGEIFPKLPKTLTCLTIDSCPHLKTIPFTLPSSLSILTLKNLHLQSLENIPNSVQILHVIDCHIERMKTLSSTLQTLHIQNTVVDSFFMLSLHSLSLKSLALNNTSTNLLALYEIPNLRSAQIHNMPSQKFLKRNSSVINLQLHNTDIETLHITDYAPNLEVLLLLNTPTKILEGFPMTLRHCLCRHTKLSFLGMISTDVPLTLLSIEDCPLKSLPFLPPSLQTLSVKNTSLERLPELPPSLRTLDVDFMG